MIAPCGAGGDGGFRAAALLVAGVEIDVEVALIDDVGVTESCGFGDGAAVEICAECGDGAGCGDGGGACGDRRWGFGWTPGLRLTGGFLLTG